MPDVNIASGEGGGGKYVIFTGYCLYVPRIVARVVDPNQIQTYADAVRNKGAALHNCFGFIDGTVRPIARPEEHQRTVYNGHKRVHGLKFQSLALPNGIIANMFSPISNQRVFCLHPIPKGCDCFRLMADYNRCPFLQIFNLLLFSGLQRQRLSIHIV